jgi:hypothetical protein
MNRMSDRIQALERGARRMPPPTQDRVDGPAGTGIAVETGDARDAAEARRGEPEVPGGRCTGVPIRGGTQTMAKTGIEISPGISDTQRKTDELLHALHLDWFGAAIKSLAAGATMTITLDGNRREEPWAGVHFVACAPGTHELELEWNSHTIGVEADRVTELVYTVQTVTSHGLPAASLLVRGTRGG